MALTNLQILTANSNRIRVLEHHSFYGLHRLTCLHLQKNLIKQINLGDLPLGVYIFLEKNQIQRNNGLVGLPHLNPESLELRIRTFSGMLYHMLLI